MFRACGNGDLQLQHGWRCVAACCLFSLSSCARVQFPCNIREYFHQIQLGVLVRMIFIPVNISKYMSDMRFWFPWYRKGQENLYGPYHPAL